MEIGYLKKILSYLIVLSFPYLARNIGFKSNAGTKNTEEGSVITQEHSCNSHMKECSSIM